MDSSVSGYHFSPWFSSSRHFPYMFHQFLFFLMAFVFYLLGGISIVYFFFDGKGGNGFVSANCDISILEAAAGSDLTMSQNTQYRRSIKKNTKNYTNRRT